VTANGKTRSAYATLKPDYAYDGKAIYLNNSGYTMVGRALKNKAPSVTIEGDVQRVARVGEPIALSAVVTDDGIPRPRPAPMAGGSGSERDGPAGRLARVPRSGRQGHLLAGTVQGLPGFHHRGW